MHLYAAYIFDYDDTLVQTYKHVLENINPELARRNSIHYLGKEQGAKLWGNEIREYLPYVFEGISDIEAVIASLSELTYSRPAPAFKCSTTLLRRLQAANCFLGIYSTGLRSMVESGIVRSLGMQPNDFSLLFFTSEYNTRKPTTLVITEVERRYQELYGIKIHADDMLFIGDSVKDYETAKGTGAGFVAVTSGFSTREDFLSLGLLEQFIFEDINVASHALLEPFEN